MKGEKHVTVNHIYTIDIHYIESQHVPLTLLFSSNW